MYMMAEKNSVEKEGMRLSHIRDSAAMCNILAKLNEQVLYNNTITIYLTILFDTYDISIYIYLY
jgi:hypothetical protein